MAKFRFRRFGIRENMWWTRYRLWNYRQRECAFWTDYLPTVIGYITPTYPPTTEVRIFLIYPPALVMARLWWSSDTESSWAVRGSTCWSSLFMEEPHMLGVGGRSLSPSTLGRRGRFSSSLRITNTRLTVLNRPLMWRKVSWRKYILSCKEKLILAVLSLSSDKTK